MASELALVRRFPILGSLPRVPLCELPTPVEPVRLPGVPEGALYAKRDDRSCPLYGGNKPRKLEFLLGSARARRSRRLLTTGGLGTHHGLATALLGRQSGLATTVILVRQPVTAHVRAQLRAMAHAGAELVYGGSVAGAALQVVRCHARSVLAGERPTWVPTGGSSPLGNVGFVSAALELAEQVREGALPEPAELYVPVGSGGTLAGLAVGLRLAGLRTRPVGVLVTDILPPSPRRLARLARATLRRLRRADPSLPAVAFGAEDFDLTSTQLGGGYGAPTEAGRSALARARDAGLGLELAYTAKCLAEVLARIETGRARLPAVFWHTYSAVHPPEVEDPQALPPPLRRFLEGPLEA